LLNRLALSTSAIDPASFTVIRLLAAALMLWLLVRLKAHYSERTSNAQLPKLKVLQFGGSTWLPWASTVSLFVYAVGFSWAYVAMPAAMGALILFGSVQLTMIVAGLLQGDKLSVRQWLGFFLALFGMVQLTLPSLSTPSFTSAFAMVIAGVAWGVYSLLGRLSTQPLQSTAANFLRTIPLALLLAAAAYQYSTITPLGFLYAVIAGAFTSGIGYALWYAVLPTIKSSDAAGIQLSVPVVTIILGATLLQEKVTLQIVIACMAILGGCVLVLLRNEKIVLIRK
jgi:drug/metabolite transporter (DMT)-like permease